MTIGARYGRLNLFACALFVSALMFAAEALAAPRAAELGPEMPLAEPAGGFVGKLSVTPQGGPAGTHVTSGDPIDLLEARKGPEPPRLAAEQVGPLGGTVGAPANVAESNSSDQSAAPNARASRG